MAKRATFHTPLLTTEHKQLFVPEVYLEHLTEFADRWYQRQSYIESDELVPADLSEIDDCLEGHLEGLFRPREGAVQFLTEQLVEADPPIPFAAAFVLLRLQDSDGQKAVIDCFVSSEDERLTNVVDALLNSPIKSVQTLLESQVDQKERDEVHVGFAVRILAYHGALKDTGTVKKLFESEDPVVRHIAWQATVDIESRHD